MRDIRERAGDVDPAALAAIEQFPEEYPMKAKPRRGDDRNRGSFRDSTPAQIEQRRAELPMVF